MCNLCHHTSCLAEAVEWPGTWEPLTVSVEGFCSFPEYIVEAILPHRLQTCVRARPVTMYLVTWQRFGHEHNTREGLNITSLQMGYTPTPTLLSTVPASHVLSSLPHHEVQGLNLNTTAKVKLKVSNMPAPRLRLRTFSPKHDCTCMLLKYLPQHQVPHTFWVLE
jgi:hypothetical protein